MDKVIGQYSEAYRNFGNSKEAVLWPKGRQKERFDILTKPILNENFSILDFGCGLAHFKDYLAEKYKHFEYTGVDIVEAFIQENVQNHPDDTFVRMQSLQDITGEYDYSVVSGAFNLLYEEDYESQWRYIQNALTYLFDITKVCLSCNFMIDQVDYTQDGAYHQNAVELYMFVSKQLSRRLILDQSYMPYEFTIHIFKDQTIIRPDNLFAKWENK